MSSGVMLEVQLSSSPKRKLRLHQALMRFLPRALPPVQAISAG
uniref:Uncharacterized protein n=1 Tax=Pseudomonas monteilii TaxID=76759 RepID=A0A6B7Q1T5_9PSED|nr:hypothetical protein [Pseudomonas monteilii]